MRRGEGFRRAWGGVKLPNGCRLSYWGFRGLLRASEMLVPLEGESASEGREMKSVSPSTGAGERPCLSLRCRCCSAKG